MIVNLVALDGASNELEESITARIVTHLNTLEIGEDIIWSDLFTPIIQEQNISVRSVFIGRSSNPTGSDDIVMANAEKAQGIEANITVNRL